MGDYCRERTTFLISCIEVSLNLLCFPFRKSRYLSVKLEQQQQTAKLISLTVHVMVYFYYLAWDSYSKHGLKAVIIIAVLCLADTSISVLHETSACYFQQGVLKAVPCRPGTAYRVNPYGPLPLLPWLGHQSVPDGEPLPRPTIARIACVSQQSNVCSLPAEQPAVIKGTYHMDIGRLAHTIDSTIHHETAHLTLHNLALL